MVWTKTGVALTVAVLGLAVAASPAQAAPGMTDQPSQLIKKHKKVGSKVRKHHHHHHHKLKSVK